MQAQADDRTRDVRVRPPFPAAVIVNGPPWRSYLQQEGRVLLSKPEVRIGRMETNDIVLSDSNVSRNHAVIRWTAHGYVLQDSGSSNGTIVEGHRIDHPVLLLPGQRFVVGRTQMTFVSLAPPADIPIASPPRQLLESENSLSREVPQQSMGAPPGDTTAAQPLVFPTVPAPQPALVRWLRRQGGKRYWKVFLIGLAGFVATMIVLRSTDNPNLVPMALLIGSAVVPVAFVRYCFEEGAFADMPVHVVGFTFVSGAIMGLLLAAVLESNLVLQSSSGAVTTNPASWFLVGLLEETAKVAAVLVFIRQRALRSELDGLILGAAAGMGFAALESAGYGFSSFLSATVSSIDSNQSIHTSFVAGIDAMQHSIVLRMMLALFGHGVWTAIVCATIWRERGRRTFRLTGGVVLALAISVCLHGLYDWGASLLPADSSDVAIVLAQLPVGLAGLFILRFFIVESLHRAALGPEAAPPPPLLVALRAYLAHPFRDQQQARAAEPAVSLMPAFASAAPVSIRREEREQPFHSTEVAGNQAAGVHCPGCHRLNNPGSRFCGSCGQPLSYRH